MYDTNNRYKQITMLTYQERTKLLREIRETALIYWINNNHNQITMLTHQERMKRKLLPEIRDAALDYWIDHNHLVATGRKVGEEWLDDEDD